MFNTVLNFSQLGKQADIALAQQKSVSQDHFDSATDLAKTVQSLDDKLFASELMQIRRFALFAVGQLSSDILSGELDDDELPTDRLDVFLNPDIEQTEDNQTLIDQYIQIRAANMADAYMSLGVPADVVDAIFGDDIEEADLAIESAAEIVDANTPTGEDLDEFVTLFLFGDDELDMNAGEVAGFDSAEVGKTKVRKTKAGQTLVYRGAKAVRHGKVVVVNKRVGNTMMKVKLSPKQKAALRRALSKANTSGAIARRLRSLNIGRKAGIYKKNNGL